MTKWCRDLLEVEINDLGILWGGNILVEFFWGRNISVGLFEGRLRWPNTVLARALVDAI